LDAWKTKRTVLIQPPMKKTILTLALLLCSGCSPSTKEDVSIEVNFSPNGGVMEAYVREINLTKETIQIQAYSFTNQQVGQALLAAHHRGVKVEAILDRENTGNPNSLIHLLHENGISIRIDDKHAIAHNKIMILDSMVVLTGSANYTKAASESNAENGLVIKNNRIAIQYILNWELHKKHSFYFGG